MDQHDHLVGLEPVGLGGRRVEHLRDALDLQKVISGAERPHLVLAAVLRALWDGVGIGVRPDPVVLAVFEIGLDGVAGPETPLDAAFERGFEDAVVALDDAAAAESRGDRLEERVDERLLAAPYVAVFEICFQHSHTAIYIVADCSGRYTAVFGVDTRDAADREPIALVAVGHTDRVLFDARKMRRVPQLFEGSVLDDLLEEALAREHPRRNPHVARPRDLPDVVADLPQCDVARLVRSHTGRS